MEEKCIFNNKINTPHQSKFKSNQLYCNLERIDSRPKFLETHINSDTDSDTIEENIQASNINTKLQELFTTYSIVNIFNTVFKDENLIPKLFHTFCFCCEEVFSGFFSVKIYCKLCNNVFCKNCCNREIDGFFWGFKSRKFTICEVCNENYSKFGYEKNFLIPTNSKSRITKIENYINNYYQEQEDCQKFQRMFVYSNNSNDSTEKLDQIYNLILDNLVFCILEENGLDYKWCIPILQNVKAVIALVQPSSKDLNDSMNINNYIFPKFLTLSDINNCVIAQTIQAAGCSVCSNMKEDYESLRFNSNLSKDDKQFKIKKANDQANNISIQENNNYNNDENIVDNNDLHSHNMYSTHKTFDLSKSPGKLADDLIKTVNGYCLIKKLYLKTFPNFLKNPKIILFDCSLEYNRSSHLSLISLKEYIQAENYYYENLRKKILYLKPDVILIQGKIAIKLKDALLKHHKDILIITKVESSHLYNIARFTKTYVLTCPELLDNEMIVGKCEALTISHIENGTNNNYLIIFDGCNPIIGSSLLFFTHCEKESALLEKAMTTILLTARNIYVRKFLLDYFNCNISYESDIIHVFEEVTKEKYLYNDFELNSNNYFETHYDRYNFKSHTQTQNFNINTLNLNGLKLNLEESPKESLYRDKKYNEIKEIINNSNNMNASYNCLNSSYFKFDGRNSNNTLHTKGKDKEREKDKEFNFQLNLNQLKNSITHSTDIGTRLVKVKSTILKCEAENLAHSVTFYDKFKKEENTHKSNFFLGFDTTILNSANIKIKFSKLEITLGEPIDPKNNQIMKFFIEKNRNNNINHDNNIEYSSDLANKSFNQKQLSENQVLSVIKNICDEPASIKLEYYSNDLVRDKPLGKLILDMINSKQAKCLKCKKSQEDHIYYIYKKMGRLKISYLTKQNMSSNDSDWKLLNSHSQLESFILKNNTAKYADDIYSYGVCRHVCRIQCNKDKDNKEIKDNKENNDFKDKEFRKNSNENLNNISPLQVNRQSNINFNNNKITKNPLCTQCYNKIVTPIIKIPREVFNSSTAQFFKFFLYNNDVKNRSVELKDFSYVLNGAEVHSKCNHLVNYDIDRIFFTENGAIRFQYEKTNIYVIEPSVTREKNDIHYNNILNYFVSHSKQLVSETVNLLKCNIKLIMTEIQDQMLFFQTILNRPDLHDESNRMLEMIHVIANSLEISDRRVNHIEAFFNNCIASHLKESRFEDYIKFLLFKKKIYFRIVQTQIKSVWLVKAVNLFEEIVKIFEQIISNGYIGCISPKQSNNNLNYGFLTSMSNNNITTNNNNLNISSTLSCTNANVAANSNVNANNNTNNSKLNINHSNSNDSLILNITIGNGNYNDKENTNININDKTYSDKELTLQNKLSQIKMEKSHNSQPISEINTGNKLNNLDAGPFNFNIYQQYSKSLEEKKAGTVYFNVSNNSSYQEMLSSICCLDEFHKSSTADVNEDDFSSIIAYTLTSDKYRDFICQGNKFKLIELKCDRGNESGNKFKQHIGDLSNTHKHNSFDNFVNEPELLNTINTDPYSNRNNDDHVKPNTCRSNHFEPYNQTKLDSEFYITPKIDEWYLPSLSFDSTKNKYSLPNAECCTKMINNQLETELLTDDSSHFIMNISNNSLLSRLKTWSADLEMPPQIPKKTNINKSKQVFPNKINETLKNNTYTNEVKHIAKNELNDKKKVGEHRHNQSITEKLSIVPNLSNTYLGNIGTSTPIMNNPNNTNFECMDNKSTLPLIDISKQYEDIMNTIESLNNYKKELITKITLINPSSKINKIEVKGIDIGSDYVASQLDVEIICYFPRQFEALRIAYCAGYENFILSLAYSFEWDSVTGGKSSSKFYKTHDNRFILKSVSKKEFKMFIESASQYFHHNAKYLFHKMPSALAKILGAYRINKRKGQDGSSEKTFIFLMENIFYNKDTKTVNTINPLNPLNQLNNNLNLNLTKTQSNNNHINLSNKHSIIQFQNQKSTDLNFSSNNNNDHGKTSLTLNTNSFNPNNLKKRPKLKTYDLKGSKINRYISIKDQKTEQVLLDTNFKEDFSGEPIVLEKGFSKLLHAAIHNDTLLLSKLNVVDYSLLLIIDDVSQDIDEKIDNFPIKTIKLGIIDYARKYTWDKQLENLGKTLINRMQAPTIVHPSNYRERFIEAMADYFIGI